MLKKIKYVLFLIVCFNLFSCAPYQVQVSGNVNITLDLTQITEAFKVQCRRELGSDATILQVNDCAELKLAALLKDIESILSQGSKI